MPTTAPRHGVELRGLRGLRERSCTRASAGAGPDPGVCGACLPPREWASAASTAAASEAPQDRGGTYLAQPFKQAFCMASTIYRRNSCASSWFPKRKCRAISREREKHQTSRDKLTPSPLSPTAVCSSATPAIPGGQQQVRESRAQQEPCVPTPSARAGGFLRQPEGPHCPSSTGRHGCRTSAGTKGGKASGELVFQEPAQSTGRSQGRRTRFQEPTDLCLLPSEQASVLTGPGTFGKAPASPSSLRHSPQLARASASVKGSAPPAS